MNYLELRISYAQGYQKILETALISVSAAAASTFTGDLCDISSTHLYLLEL